MQTTRPRIMPLKSPHQSKTKLQNALQLLKYVTERKFALSVG